MDILRGVIDPEVKVPQTCQLGLARRQIHVRGVLVGEKGRSFFDIVFHVHRQCEVGLVLDVEENGDLGRATEEAKRPSEFWKRSKMHEPLPSNPRLIDFNWARQLQIRQHSFPEIVIECFAKEKQELVGVSVA